MELFFNVDRGFTSSGYLRADSGPDIDQLASAVAHGARTGGTIYGRYADGIRRQLEPALPAGKALQVGFGGATMTFRVAEPGADWARDAVRLGAWVDIDGTLIVSIDVTGRLPDGLRLGNLIGPDPDIAVDADAYSHYLGWDLEPGCVAAKLQLLLGCPVDDDTVEAVVDQATSLLA